MGLVSHEWMGLVSGVGQDREVDQANPNPDSSHKNDIQVLFKERYIWCLENRSKNRRRLRLSMRRSRVRWNHLRGLVAKKNAEAGQNLHQKAKLPHSQGFIIQEALSVYGFLSTANSQEKLCHTVSGICKKILVSPQTKMRYENSITEMKNMLSISSQSRILSY